MSKEIRELKEEIRKLREAIERQQTIRYVYVSFQSTPDPPPPPYYPPYEVTWIGTDPTIWDGNLWD